MVFVSPDYKNDFVSKNCDVEEGLRLGTALPSGQSNADGTSATAERPRTAADWPQPRCRLWLCTGFCAAIAIVVVRSRIGGAGCSRRALAGLQQPRGRRRAAQCSSVPCGKLSKLGHGGHPTVLLERGVAVVAPAAIARNDFQSVIGPPRAPGRLQDVTTLVGMQRPQH